MSSNSDPRHSKSTSSSVCTQPLSYMDAVTLYFCLIISAHLGHIPPTLPGPLLPPVSLIELSAHSGFSVDSGLHREALYICFLL